MPSKEGPPWSESLNLKDPVESRKKRNSATDVSNRFSARTRELSTLESLPPILMITASPFNSDGSIEVAMVRVLSNLNLGSKIRYELVSLNVKIPSISSSFVFVIIFFWINEESKSIEDSKPDDFTPSTTSRYDKIIAITRIFAVKYFSIIEKNCIFKRGIEPKANYILSAKSISLEIAVIKNRSIEALMKIMISFTLVY
mmetsp:Transcript_11691/g.11738  ORF Transcript_11691/g.11738 Transcript_11691/m.11738 type:complete len:200 (+) Transcript_11691:2138-2737(+)